MFDNPFSDSEIQSRIEAVRKGSDCSWLMAAAATSSSPALLTPPWTIPIRLLIIGSGRWRKR